nr:hypothetical protein [Muribacter muris]
MPLFTHAGSGYQLLANIGRQFQIPHYMWQQNTDGSVYIGSWQDSDYPDNEWHIDSDSTLSQFSNAITIPVNAAIRPGALVNGKRIIKVNLQGDHYELTWADLDDAGKPLQKSPERRAIEKEFPELAGGYHLARYAKIVSIADPSQSGDIADPFRPKYAVDVQLLDENNQDDKSVPVFPAVPLPVTSTASQGGDFAFPEIGTIVEIGFINGRSDKPVIRNFYPQGKTLPQVGIGETLRQQRSEVFERVDASGNKRTQVLGNIDEITASNKSIGVGGNASESIKEHKILVVKGNIDFSADGQVIISGQNILLQADTITLDGEVEITKSLRVAQSISASQSISVGSGFSATGSQVSINGSLTALTMTAENVQANTIAGGSVTSGGVSIEHSLNHLANSNKKMVSELTRIVNEINSAFDSVNSKIYALEKAIDNKPQEDTPQSDAMINGGSSVNKPSAL